MNRSLEENGYIIFRDIIDEKSINYARNQVNSKVNYYKIKPFIDLEMMKNINRLTNMDLDYIKYRVSNSNNSSDAGAFHRDIHTYDKTQPIYTCLAYLDESMLEIIPKTHKILSIPYLDFSKTFKSKIQLKMRPGDLLLFNASLLHRGIFYNNNSNNRRLIQLFDCVSKRNMREFEKSILHIPCRDKCSSLIANFLIKINKNKSSSNLANRLALLSSFRGYGYRYNSVKFIRGNDTDIKHISTESERNRPNKNIYDNKFHESNTYNMHKYNHKDIIEDKRRIYNFMTFGIENVVVLLMLALLILALYLLIAKVPYKKLKNKVKKNLRKKKLGSRTRKNTP